MHPKTLITGFPRIGQNRELKKGLEKYWNGKITENELQQIAKELRKKHWLFQKDAGIDLISSNDFSLYDHMLDTIVMLNAIPERFIHIKDMTEKYFAMARGTQDAPAMEMTKWFNTNYHFIVPELHDGMKFRLDASKIVSEYREAKDLGIKTKINIVGPLTFLGLSKTKSRSNPNDFFEDVFEIYKQLVAMLAALDDCIYLQIDEPIFAKDPTPRQLSLLRRAYEELGAVSDNIRIIVTTYFEHSCEATEILAQTPIWGLGLDFVYGPKNLSNLGVLNGKTLVAGIVDGRNVWINDFEASLQLLDDITEKIDPGQIVISTSCSLLHTPYSVAGEPESSIKKWMAFSREKILEVVVLGEAFHSKQTLRTVSSLIEENTNRLKERTTSDLFNNKDVAERVSNIRKTVREGTFGERSVLQKRAFDLPSFPTTTIGSFPQTAELRTLRRNFKRGEVSAAEYETTIQNYIDESVSFQEEIGLDVLVHGEPERNDMVEYFGEMLEGFHFTTNGWVQSYGSRCVKPPIIYGDVSRPEPMTVKWITYAQSKTKKIMKGMLTGPVTILNWSFVRTDIPRSEVSRQIAVALSDEVNDLQEAGIKIIQVDEAAFKEGYPLRKANIPEYERWAVESFKLAVSVARMETQIHTHMCYSEFNDIIQTIERMDADVITIETARSGNELLNIFHEMGYENEIGPGVYDIHSPRVPSVEEFERQITTRLEVIPRSKIWINPDCGLKTRKWEEVKPALKNMVCATQNIRNN